MLALVDDSEHKAVLAANVPRVYAAAHGPLDWREMGFEKLNHLLKRLPGVRLDGTNRAWISRDGDPSQ
jgi:hypothetical protein